MEDGISEDDLNKAIAAMREALDKPATAREMRVMAKYDQLAAQLRDMDSEELEAAKQRLEGTTDLTREEVDDWVHRMLTESD